MIRASVGRDDSARRHDRYPEEYGGPEAAPVGGYALMDRLRREFGVELEMAQPHYALAMTGAGDDTERLTRLADALLALDRDWAEPAPPVPGPPSALPAVRMGPRAAMCAPAAALPLAQAAGRVCAQYLWVYPPGVPLAAPGEELTAELLEELSAAGAALRCSPETEPGTVRVVL